MFFSLDTAGADPTLERLPVSFEGALPALYLFWLRIEKVKIWRGLAAINLFIYFISFSQSGRRKGDRAVGWIGSTTNHPLPHRMGPGQPLALYPRIFPGARNHMWGTHELASSTRPWVLFCLTPGHTRLSVPGLYCEENTTGVAGRNINYHLDLGRIRNALSLSLPWLLSANHGKSGLEPGSRLCGDLSAGLLQKCLSIRCVNVSFVSSMLWSNASKTRLKATSMNLRSIKMNTCMTRLYYTIRESIRIRQIARTLGEWSLCVNVIFR